MRLGGAKGPQAASLAEQAALSKKAAVSEVEKLLQHPEDLKRLPKLVETYKQKQQANKAQLTAAMAAQTDAARAGIELLEAAEKALRSMMDRYKMIDTLCTECSALIQNQDLIQALSMVHSNLSKTLQDAEDIKQLPEEARAVEALLQSDENLIQAFESLARLEGTSALAQKALEANRQLNSSDMSSIAVYFKKVSETLKRVEERLWATVREAPELGRRNPGALVNVVRIIELQEQVDKLLRKSGQIGVIPPKHYRRRAEDHIRNSVTDAIAPLLQDCSLLGVETGTNLPVLTASTIQKAEEFVDQLVDVNDWVTPCFPEEYHIFKTYFDAYHYHFSGMLDAIGACAGNLDNGQILDVIDWMSRYQESMEELGIPELETYFPTGPGLGFTLLVSTYTERVETKLKQWCDMIMKHDMEGEPRADDQGRLRTAGGTDFFQMVNSNVETVEENAIGEMLLKTGFCLLRVMGYFQDKQRAVLEAGKTPEGAELSEDLVCALVNNAASCYDESLLFAEHMEEVLADHCKGVLDIEQHCRGFLELAKLGCTRLLGAIFSDPPFLAQFPKLGEAPAGAATGVILATLGDYLGDFRVTVDTPFFRRLAELALEETVAYYMAAMLVHTQAVTLDWLKVAQKDHADICVFFETYTTKDKISKAAGPLEDLRALAGSDNVDTFVLAYTTILQTCPGVTPGLLEKLVQARLSPPDFTQQNVKESMAGLREVYQTRQRALGLPEEATSLQRPKNPPKDWAPFRVALAAVKKREAASVAPPSTLYSAAARV